jgi:hypothetical protein
MEGEAKEGEVAGDRSVVLVFDRGLAAGGSAPAWLLPMT